MKTKLLTILAIFFSAAFFSSCTEEVIEPTNTNETRSQGSEDQDKGDL